MRVQENNKELTTWWGRYCESHGDIPHALACYRRAKDVLSIVRVHCYTQNFEEAEEQVTMEACTDKVHRHVHCYTQIFKEAEEQVTMEACTDKVQRHVHCYTRSCWGAEKQVTMEACTDKVHRHAQLLGS
jgi:hypothetical protein